MKAGGGYKVTIGEMCRMMLTKLDWFGTLFPRLPVSVGKELEQKLKQAKQATRYVDSKCRVVARERVKWRVATHPF